MNIKKQINVMIAGIGGASLGTELLKALKLAGGYAIYGCDISSTAYGLYEPGFAGTIKVEADDYVQNVINACHDTDSKFVIPGGEQPMVLLGKSKKLLSEEGITLVGNSSEIIRLCSNKDETFCHLSKIGIPIPRTIVVSAENDIRSIGLPCIIKPATGSGGSVSVFFATTQEEAMVYVEYIRKSGNKPLAQEYINVEEGEFTVGVLSLPTHEIVGAVALKRDLSTKLSTVYRGRGGVVSSGYSQGYIDNYPDICRQAIMVADTLNSTGPINIQGRVRKGRFLPFEINPRFSASTYLRALAGFNEADLYIKFLINGEKNVSYNLHTGLYLRSLTEQYVSSEAIL